MPHHIRSSCNGTTICDCHQRTHVHEPQATPPIGHLAFPPYYSCQQRSSNNRRYPDYPRPSRAIHLATNNLSYPSPHYATAYAPSNEVHSSWQPTYHREYHTQIVSRSIFILFQCKRSSVASVGRLIPARGCQVW